MSEPSAGVELQARHWFVIAGIALAGFGWLIANSGSRWATPLIVLGVSLLNAGLIALAIRRD